MAAPSELSIEEIRSFIVSRGGKVTNHDLVKHFKRFLTDPEHKDVARETFKKYVNLLGSIKNENGEKYIVLKKKKPSVTPETPVSKGDESLVFSPSTSFNESSEQREPPPYIPPPAVFQQVQNLNVNSPPEPIYKQEISQRHPEQFYKQDILQNTVDMPLKQRPIQNVSDVVYRNQEIVHRQLPLQEQVYNQMDAEYRLPVYRYPDHVRSHSIDNSDSSVVLRRESIDDTPPPISQRKESLRSVPSVDSIGIPSVLDSGAKKQRTNIDPVSPQGDVTSSNVVSASNVIHVSSSNNVKKQRKQIENIPPDENDATPAGISARSGSCRSLNSDCEPVSVKERLERFNKIAVDGEHVRRPSVKKGSEEEDQVSVMSMNPTCHEWIVKSSAANYQALAKMLNDDPQLVRVRNALHWAAKHGNEDICKLVAGKCPELANYKSNGGYTPLHIAMQFRNEGIYNLLIRVYGADRDIRDHSGRKPRQYAVTEDTTISPDTYKRIMKKKQADQKFLRIGSLNIRVKKTTHAFSNFLGVGTSHKIKNNLNTKLGKMTSWGSADDIQDDTNKMPPPQCTKVKRKIAKKNQESFASKSRSTPSTPNQPRSLIGSDMTDNISPSPSSSTLHDSDSDTACGFDAHWQEKGIGNNK